MKRLGKMIVAILFVLFGCWFLLRQFERKSLYVPDREIVERPENFGLVYEEVTLVTHDDKRLHGWWFPVENARGTLIHCHGNAGNISGRVWMVPFWQDAGLNVFHFDYRGYGKSNGRASEKGTYLDAEAAFDFVHERYYPNQSAPPILVHGRSLGGGVAIQLAVTRPVKALIVDSTFSSAVAVGEAMFPLLPVRQFMKFRYESITKVGALTLPKLFAHSPDDEMIPFSQGQALFDEAADPKSFFQLSGGHNEAGWHRSPEYGTAINDLIDQVLGDNR